MSQFRARLYFICFILAAFGCVVVGRLFVVQVIEGAQYAERSRDQSQQRRVIPAHRGSILDRNGGVLATSVAGSNNSSTTVPSLHFPGPGQVGGRVYPLGDIAGPLLGYVGNDGYGLGGVEFSYDNYLRGEDGWTILEKDGRRKCYRKIGMPLKNPRNGCDVVLTIDMNIQKIAQNVLKQTVERLKAHGGMVIVTDPRTGKILAMANEPSFNPNVPSEFSLKDRCNECISTMYEPGSTFKVVTASAALQEHLMKESDIISGNNGAFKVFDQVIHDDKPYGNLTFVKALAYSSNVCFAKVANIIGNDRLYNYARDYGFGVHTDIELPGEQSGIVHPVRTWSGRTRVTMAIGQEVSVTFLQLAFAYGAIANKGVLLAPRICEKVTDASGNPVEISSTKPVRQVVSEQTAARLKLMLKDVVDEGTGKNASIEGVSVAGKTGTAQKTDSSGSYSKTRYWSSFIGFLPVDNPVLLCGVVIDEPANAEMGGVAAAPVFKKIMTQIISDPELEFAQEILHNSMTPAPAVPEKTVPLICGMSRSQAQKLLADEGIPYTMNGSGPTVTYQAPESGNSLIPGGELVLQFDVKQDSLHATERIPDCQGKDLRDAVNILNLRGIRPYAVGAGIVKKQQPLPGTMFRPAQPCTLYCAFEG